MSREDEILVSTFLMRLMADQTPQAECFHASCYHPRVFVALFGHSQSAGVHSKSVPPTRKINTAR